MLYKTSFTCSLLIVLGLHTFAQLEIFDVRDFGMGSSSVGSESINSISKNPSIQPIDGKNYFSCNVINNYTIRELSPFSLKYQHKFGENNCLLAGIGKMGGKYFSEQYFEVGVSKHLGSKLSAGIRLNYSTWIIPESTIENSKTWEPELGIFANPFQNFFFGVIIRNPVRFRMTTIASNNMFAEINPGISFRISEKLIIAGSVLQINNQPVNVQTGIEYRFHKILFLRCGIRTNPLTQSFGISLKMSCFNLDMGLRTNPYLGNSTAMALTFAL